MSAEEAVAELDDLGQGAIREQDGDLLRAEAILLRALRQEGRSDVADAYERAVDRVGRQRWG